MRQSHMAIKKFILNHPKEMYLLAVTEMCQRFAFWGIGNLLVLFLVQSQHFTDMRADNLFGLFTGIAFILPVAGGYLADKLGYRLPIFWGCIFTAIGCFLIATGSLPLIYLALVFVAIGGAVFTPSVYALLGIIYKNKHALREGGFSIYYSFVNIGVFLAMIVLGYFGQTRHWNVAYLVAAVVQLLGLIPFNIVAKSSILSQKDKETTKAKVTFFLPKLHRHELHRIFVIFILALFSIVFWMAYNQGGSSMNLFALRYTDRQVLGFTMPPSWLLASESVYLILFAFPLAYLYKFLAERKKDPTPPMKCALSLIFIGLCFLIMSISSRKIPTGAETAALSPYYLLSAYGLMALGEMLICPIGLSLIAHLSPHKYTAMLVGVWYFCIGIAFYLGGVFAGFMGEFKISEFFNVFVLASFISAIALLLLVKKLNQLRHLNSL